MKPRKPLSNKEIKDYISNLIAENTILKQENAALKADNDAIKTNPIITQFQNATRTQLENLFNWSSMSADDQIRWENTLKLLKAIVWSAF